MVWIILLTYISRSDAGSDHIMIVIVIYDYHIIIIIIHIHIHIHRRRAGRRRAKSGGSGSGGSGGNLREQQMKLYSPFHDRSSDDDFARFMIDVVVHFATPSLLPGDLQSSPYFSIPSFL